MQKRRKIPTVRPRYQFFFFQAPLLFTLLWWAIFTSFSLYHNLAYNRVDTVRKIRNNCSAEGCRSTIRAMESLWMGGGWIRYSLPPLDRQWSPRLLRAHGSPQHPLFRKHFRGLSSSPVFHTKKLWYWGAYGKRSTSLPLIDDEADVRGRKCLFECVIDSVVGLRLGSTWVLAQSHHAIESHIY